MAGRLIEENPELAHEHAQTALRKAGRVDIVREAVALTSYATGRFAEALREIRTVRRLSGRDDMRLLEADCERAVGRPQKAVELIKALDQTTLDQADRVEFALVLAGARSDLGELEAGLAVLSDLRPLPPELEKRVSAAEEALRGANSSATDTDERSDIDSDDRHEDQGNSRVASTDEDSADESASGWSRTQSPEESDSAEQLFVDLEDEGRDYFLR